MKQKFIQFSKYGKSDLHSTGKEWENIDFPYSSLTRRFRVDANQRRALNILETITLLKNNRFKIRLLSRKENTALPYSRVLQLKDLCHQKFFFKNPDFQRNM